MPVIRIEEFKDDKEGFWVSNFPAVIIGGGLSRADCSQSFLTHLTLKSEDIKKPCQWSLLSFVICRFEYHPWYTQVHQGGPRWLRCMLPLYVHAGWVFATVVWIICWNHSAQSVAPKWLCGGIRGQWIIFREGTEVRIHPFIHTKVHQGDWEVFF